LKPRHGSFGATATQDTFEEKLNAIMQEKQQLSDVTVRAGTWKKLFVAGNDEQSTPAWDYDTSELKIHIHNSSHSVSKGPERYEALNHHSFTWGPNNIPTRWVAWDCSWDCRGEDWIADLNDAQLRDLFSLGSWGGFFPAKPTISVRKTAPKRRNTWMVYQQNHHEIAESHGETFEICTAAILAFRNMKLQHESNAGICFLILQGKDPWVFSQFQGSISTIPFPT